MNGPRLTAIFPKCTVSTTCSYYSTTDTVHWEITEKIRSGLRSLSHSKVFYRGGVHGPGRTVHGEFYLSTVPGTRGTQYKYIRFVLVSSAID